MVYENLIPKTETVYEIKNKIPSYEEFLKDYKEDENLNYADLSGGDLGEAKGYGPCFVCDLARNNPRWTPLKVVCPADYCPDRYKQREPSYWIHTGCWGDMEISIDGNIRCKSCYTKNFMGNWNFSCSAHQGQHLPTSHTAFKSAVKVSMDVGGVGEETGFLLYQFLKAHPEKFTRK